jgi:hypothetical protein
VPVELNSVFRSRTSNSEKKICSQWFRTSGRRLLGVIGNNPPSSGSAGYDPVGLLEGTPRGTPPKVVGRPTFLCSYGPAAVAGATSRPSVAGEPPTGISAPPKVTTVDPGPAPAPDESADAASAASNVTPRPFLVTVTWPPCCPGSKCRRTAAAALLTSDSEWTNPRSRLLRRPGSRCQLRQTAALYP